MITKIIQISSSYCDRLVEHSIARRQRSQRNMNTRLHRNREISLERTRYIFGEYRGIIVSSIF